MQMRTRLSHAVSALAIVSTLSACALAGNRSTKVSDFRAKNVNLGNATRALSALNSENFAEAVIYAEKAVEQNPNDAGFRTLLANAYFGAGRFASAEQAFKDSLSLYDNQPKNVLKVALTQIAQGKTAQALEYLEYARAALDPSDYGLAIALAGEPARAVEILRSVAEQPGADARVRQNLALAYALSQDWVNARVVASHDVPANEIDQRIEQWMQFASASKPALQVASLVGVTPAAVDPGEPVKLALVKSDSNVMQAAAGPVAPAPVEAEPAVAFAPPPPPVAPVDDAAPTMVAAAAAADMARAQQAPQVGSLTVALPEAREAAAPAPKIAAAAPAAQDFPYVEVRKKNAPARKVAASASKDALPVRKAALPLADGRTVVQLGAYSNSESVARAWNAAARRYSGLKDYAPVSAKFSGSKGTFYRLSVHGFGSPAEAARLCGSIKRGGGNCFVRTVAGDKPIQIASR